VDQTVAGGAGMGEQAAMKRAGEHHRQPPQLAVGGSA
jgi:hypothetical protein